MMTPQEHKTRALELLEEAGELRFKLHVKFEGRKIMAAERSMMVAEIDHLIMTAQVHSILSLGSPAIPRR